MESIISLNTILSVLALSLLGVVIFAVVFFIMVKITPFSVIKEIEEDQNSALAILFGSIFIALSIIISSGIS